MNFELDDVRDLNDFLGYMVINCPERFAPWHGMSLELAFSTLEEGLDRNRNKLGERTCARLTQMSAEAVRLYRSGDVKGGAFLLQDMQEILEPLADADDRHD